MIVVAAGDLELQAVLDRTEAIVAVASGEVPLAGLHSDWLVMGSGATLTLRPAMREQAALIAAVIWRIGLRARALLLTGPQQLTAGEALAWGVADAVAPAGTVPLQWAVEWASRRSGRAFDVAARLLRSRGGDPLERAMFSWLFATGEPREGLGAFLEKRPPRFRRSGRDPE